MKRVTVIVSMIALLTVAFAMSATAEDLKIVYVDLKQAFEESLAGKSAKQKFNNEMQRKQSVLDQKKKALEGAQRDFESQKMMLSEEARKEKERELMEKLQELKYLYKDNQEELRSFDEKTTKGILSNLQEIVTQIAEKEGYTMVLEKTESAILFAPDSMDITEKVIKQYNTDYLKKTATK